MTFPLFRPHPLVRGGHAQTLAGYYWPGPCPYQAQQHRVALPDGDAIVLHDDCPPGWKATDRVALLRPGLAGCHQSGYLARPAMKLNAQGIRTFRLDHRGWGAGAGSARHPFHAGRSNDVEAAFQFLTDLCPAARFAVVGFSLSGNVLLKWLGERGDDLPMNLERAAALTPPVHLAACADWMERRVNRFYNRHLVGCLCGHLRQMGESLPGLNGKPSSTVRTLREFDAAYTAPVSGFASVEDYYERCSSGPLLSRIKIPTLIIAAADDPMIPIASFHSLILGTGVQLYVADQGGHLGFIGRSGVDPDRRWLDWRIVDWITGG